MRNAYAILVGELEWKTPFERPRRTLVVMVCFGFTGLRIGYNVNTVIILEVPYKGVELLQWLRNSPP